MEVGMLYHHLAKLKAAKEREKYLKLCKHQKQRKY